MSKTTSAKQAKAPSKLAKTGKKSGVELSETELGQASGGTTALKWNLKI